MIRKRIKLTPTERISRSPIDRERLWYGATGRKLRRISHWRQESLEGVNLDVRNEKSSLLPRAGEKRSIHTHVKKMGFGKDAALPLPTAKDILEFAAPLTTHTLVKSHYAAVKAGKEVAGYTFFKIGRIKKSVIDKCFPGSRQGLTEEEIEEKVRFNILHMNYQFELADLVEMSYPKYAETFPKLLNRLEEAGVKIRFVPNRKLGYSFEKGVFIKKANQS